MRLCSFYVKSYRSIDEAKIDAIQQYCVIANPNNSGKSNLPIQMEFLKEEKEDRLIYTYKYVRH